MGTRYQIIEAIGKGGVSEVYRARDELLNREVAIKRLLPIQSTRLNEPQSVGLDREIEALTKFRHPNVVSLIEYGADQTGPFAVLELIEGETLQDLIVEGALGYPDFVEVARQLLLAMIGAHAIHLLHRDLKPGNIMLIQTPDDELLVKVLDFGGSKFLHRPSVQTVDINGAVIGSADYIAPEQIEQKPIDHRADLYSIGCVLYYALSQKRPFRGENVSQTVLNHISGNVLPIRIYRPDLPHAVGNWLMNLLERDPANRPESAEATLEGLELAIRNSEANLRIEGGAHHATPLVTEGEKEAAKRQGHFTRAV